ncbi:MULTISPECIES: CpaF family protein [unclassified Microbacterium]|uniref:CpaF family protein n=1 Tax=unclassified Microbacterium TaxID=2609290 RepID=UPI0012FD952D|nr:MULTISPECIES: CpaF/VirB11 family protein [unclassified Microbacterium]
MADPRGREPAPADITSLPLFRDTATRELPRAARHLLAAAQPAPLPGQPGVLPEASTVSAELIAPAAMAPSAGVAVRPRPRTTSSTDPDGVVDWDLVELLQKTASELLPQADAVRLGETVYLDTATASPELSERDLDNQDIILRVVNDYVTRHVLLQRGQDADWSADQRHRYVEAVFNEIFRWGRLQPLITEPGAKSINILGHDRVIVRYQDGSYALKPPIARNDAELMRLLQNIAKKRHREFSDVKASVGIDLDGARLNLLASSVATQPSAGIRIHNHVDVDLDDMVRLGTLTGPAARLLTAAVAAERNVLISGEPGAGKTTLLRACAAAIPRDELIATVETEYELYLHKLPHRHVAVLPLQMREGTGEGTHGEYSLRQAIKDALRHNLKRVLVGEVRGAEVKAMMESMQIGGGSLATIHAESPSDAIFRLANLIIEEGNLTNDYYPLRLIQQHIRLIVQVREVTAPGTAPRHIVTEIAEVTAPTTEKGPPLAQALMRYDPDAGELSFTGTQPTPTLRTQLERVGLPDGFFHTGGRR